MPPAQRPGDAEVGEQRFAARVEQDVAGGDVAVDDPGGVQVLQGGAEHVQKAADLPRRQPAPLGEHRGERPARRQVEDEHRPALRVGRDVVDGDDPRVPHPAQQGQLGEQVGPLARTGRDGRRQHLQGPLDPVRPRPGPHDAGPAGPQEPPDGVPVDDGGEPARVVPERGQRLAPPLPARPGPGRARSGGCGRGGAPGPGGGSGEGFGDGHPDRVAHGRGLPRWLSTGSIRSGA